MTLSVIVPVYNSEKYLRRCLDSILAQTRLPEEIICINDGSTDGSGDILKDYENNCPIIRVIRQKNKGRIATRRLGCKTAASDCVAFVDDDDYIDPNMYKEMLAEMENREVDLVTSGFIRYYGDNKVEENEGITPGVYSGKEYDRQILSNLVSTEKFFLYNVSGSLCNKIFKREIIATVFEKLDDNLCIGEDDICVYSYLFDSQSAVITGKNYYNYCIRPGSASSVLDTGDKDKLELFLGIMEGLFKTAEGRIENSLKQFKVIETNFRLINDAGDVLNYSDGILFPFGVVLKSDKIVLYGAGALGMSVRKWMMENGFNIIAHADKIGGEEGIIRPEQIRELSYDKLLITTINATVTESIKKDLKKLGVDDKKVMAMKV